MKHVAHRFIIVGILVFTMTSFVFPRSQKSIRPPVVAGAFYSENAAELSQQVDTFLSMPIPIKTAQDVCALIAPHAGYVYSGHVAGYAYKSLMPTQKKSTAFKTIVILSPSHRAYFRGAVLDLMHAWHTPLGDVPLDVSFAKALQKYDGIFSFNALAFSQEHAIEVQIPFLQRTLSGFRIVPILLGDCTTSDYEHIAEALHAVIKQRTDVLLVISSDLSHYHSADEAQAMDLMLLKDVQSGEPREFAVHIFEQKYEACGAAGITVLLFYLKHCTKPVSIDVVKYAHSGDVTGDTSSVVGYGAVVASYLRSTGTMSHPVSTVATNATSPISKTTTKPASATTPQPTTSARQGVTPKKVEHVKNDTHNLTLSRDEQHEALRIARETITTYLSTGKTNNFHPKQNVFYQPCGAFVTLRDHDILRGCIGNIIGYKPLWETIRDMAIAAATEDPRFTPVTLDEMSRITIEISVLSPLEKVSSADDIVLGKHGVIVKQGMRSGVFLPQVADETGWTKEEFLSHLCREKAGLSADAWKSNDVELFVFTAFVFSEGSKREKK